MRPAWYDIRQMPPPYIFLFYGFCHPGPLRGRFAFRPILLYLCSAEKDRALSGALFSCPKGSYTVWATGFSVAQTVFSVAQIVLPVAATVFSVRGSLDLLRLTVKLL